MFNNIQKKTHPTLFIQFMKRLRVWNYVSITRYSYLARSYDEKGKLIRICYSDLKSRGSVKFYLFGLRCVIRPNQRFMLRESIKLSQMQAEDDAMNGCFYSKNCKK